MTGVITGGWEFVIGAYVLSALVLGGYLLSVILRHSREFANLGRQASRTTEVE